MISERPRLPAASASTRPTVGEAGRWGRENAAWARITYRPRSRLDMRARMRRRGSGEPEVLGEPSVVDLVQRLRCGNIKYPYLFSGPFRPDGTLPAYPFSDEGRRCFRTVREEHPSAVSLPWVGGVQGRQLRLEDPRWVATAVGEIARLIDQLGVDGVHVDLEDSLFQQPPDPAYPRNFNRFFDRLRWHLPDAFVSAVIPSTAPAVRCWKQRHSVAEVDELVTMVDQLAVMYYDTSIQDDRTFDENLAAQVDHLARWKTIAPQTQLLVGLGTFTNVPRLRSYRNLRVESIESHFRALNSATTRHAKQVVDGNAVYSEWTTSAGKWSRLHPFLT